MLESHVFEFVVSVCRFPVCRFSHEKSNAIPSSFSSAGLNNEVGPSRFTNADLNHEFDKLASEVSVPGGSDNIAEWWSD